MKITVTTTPKKSLMLAPNAAALAFSKALYDLLVKHGHEPSGYFAGAQKNLRIGDNRSVSPNLDTIVGEALKAPLIFGMA